MKIENYNSKLNIFVKVEEEEAEERRASLAHLSLRQIFQHSIDIDDIPRWALDKNKQNVYFQMKVFTRRVV